MQPRTLRTLTALLGLALTTALTTALAQASEPCAAWHGLWTSGSSRVQISAQACSGVPGCANR